MWKTLWIILVLFAPAALAAPAAAVPAKPKLVVFLAIDQFRSDYLTRFESLFLPATQAGGKPGGFRYFMDKGAYFANAQTAHAFNVTAVGHAAMLTGSQPYLHGIISNYWYDQGMREKYYCVEDADAQLVGGSTGPHTGRSPRNLQVTTVGDELKNALGGQPRVVSVAMKDRAAILMGGHRADIALWYDETAKGWITSTYYAPDKKLPDWVTAWNQIDPLAKAPEQWTLLLPTKDYAYSTPMAPEMVSDGRGLGKKFPHPIKHQLAAFLTSPWANSFTLDTALRAAEAYQLGRHATPDLLAVSLSAFDATGHNYGPLSLEMEDTTLRLDRALAAFLDGIARQVPGGLANVALVLTADHGVQINPAALPSLKLPGGDYDLEGLQRNANTRLRELFGFDDNEVPVPLIFEENVHFDHTLFQKRGKDPVAAARALARWLRTQPFIATAQAKEDLLEGHVTGTEIERKMSVSVHPTRSGDVVYTTKPGYLGMEHISGGTDHENATVQDASIPLIFVGPAFRPGRYFDDAYLIDAAPTLSSVLGLVPPSGSLGHTLVRALR